MCTARRAELYVAEVDVLCLSDHERSILTRTGQALNKVYRLYLKA